LQSRVLPASLLIRLLSHPRTRSAALMSTITTSATIANLFVTGWLIRRFGVQAAMSQQTFWAALRNCTQLYARSSTWVSCHAQENADPTTFSVTLGGQPGINIIQTTQLFNVLGGAGGYLLVANAYISDIVDAEQRTASFGQLQGFVMRQSASSSGSHRIGRPLMLFHLSFQSLEPSASQVSR
jgi:hypothetical protein